MKLKEQKAPYSSLPRRVRKLIHFAAPPLKIAIALLDCNFVLCTSAQRGLLHRCCAHSCSRGKKPHAAATRASPRGADVRHARRVGSGRAAAWTETPGSICRRAATGTEARYQCSASAECRRSATSAASCSAFLPSEKSC